MDAVGSNEEAMLDLLKAQVDRALRLLDSKTSEEYKQAVAYDVNLVKRESPVEAFLRCEDHHVLKAAHRLAMYWKRRKEYFEDRWLLPMTQTGSGTLTPDQVQLLRRGFVAITSSPQAVAIFDISRLPKGSRNSAQIVFYLNSAGTSKAAQTEGYTFLHVLPGRGDTGVADRLPSEDACKLIACLPTRAKNIVLVTAYSASEEHMFEYIAHQHKEHTQASIGMSANYVIGKSVRETIRLLEEKGLDRDCVPMRLGGDYFYTKQFDDWIRTRLSIEDCMGSAPPVANTGIAKSVVKKATKRALVDTARRVIEQTTALSSCVEEGAATVTTARGSHDTSVTGETKMSSRGRRQVVCQRQPGESLQDFEKRRTYLYGKRSYERKRRKLPQLEQQFHTLDLANKQLRTNNRHLEELLSRARLLVGMYGENRQDHQRGKAHLSSPCIEVLDEDDDDDDSSLESLSFLEYV